MALKRFYIEGELNLGWEVELNDFESKHIQSSLRLKAGDEIIVFNGLEEYLAELTLASKKQTKARLKQLIGKKKEKDYSITLFQSLIKFDNFELVLEKATEIGIDEFVPMQTEYSQINLDLVSKKYQRWNKIILAASKQSERISVPTLNPAQKFQEIDFENFDHTLFFTNPNERIVQSLESVRISTLSEVKGRIAIFIGPEGGFSPKEHELAKSKNMQFLTILNSVLRSETAAIAGLVLIKEKLLEQENTV